MIWTFKVNVGEGQISANTPPASARCAVLFGPVRTIVRQGVGERVLFGLRSIHKTQFTSLVPSQQNEPKLLLPSVDSRLDQLDTFLLMASLTRGLLS